MPPAPPPTTSWRYPPAAIALHWLSVLAIATAFAAGWYRQGIDEEAEKRFLMALHQNAGLLVLALLPLRLAVRAFATERHADDLLPRWLRPVAVASHLGLYGLLFAMPLLGWTLTSAHGRPPALLGRLPLPSMAQADPDLADTLGSWHLALSWIFLALIAVHVAAALWHHFHRRDRVLLSMLPARPRATAPSTAEPPTH